VLLFLKSLFGGGLRAVSVSWPLTCRKYLVEWSFRTSISRFCTKWVGSEMEKRIKGSEYYGEKSFSQSYNTVSVQR